MTDSERKKRLIETVGLLSIPAIGRARLQRLLRAFGTTTRVLSATRHELEMVPGISPALSFQIRAGFSREHAVGVAERVRKLGWWVLFPDDEGFPHPLREVPAPPPLLFGLGQPLGPADPMIAIVGTRHPTESGRSFSRGLAAMLAKEGVTVVSGMAEGIDSAAHKGALDVGGRTVAVWGSSLDIVYPPSNRELAATIARKGTLLSEYLPGTHPDRSLFPERNRIISGLSAGVIVVEAGRKSGALITAAHALEQGRELFAVPGPPQAMMSQGTNALIKKGARLITEAEDVFEELPRLRGAVRFNRLPQLPAMTDTEKRILTHFSAGPQQIDQLSRSMQIGPSELMELLLALELKGLVRELSGKRFALAECLP